MHSRMTTYGRTLASSRALGLVLALTAGVTIPTLGLPQWITGPLVNALLFLTALRLGVSGAMVVGLVTPLAAVLRGVLPLPLLVMTPFIALGNATLVGVFGTLRGRNPRLAVGAAALAKFALLSATVTLLVARPLSLAIGGSAQVVALPAAMVEMMRWPQLATALIGGAIALGTDALIARRAEGQD